MEVAATILFLSRRVQVALRLESRMNSTISHRHFESGEPDAELVARAVLDQFTLCNVRPSDLNQYTVLAGFVLFDSPTGELKVPALATGAKCLPTSKYPVAGNTLHDSHAEVLARRSFVRWLYDEVRRAVHSSMGSRWLEHNTGSRKYQLREDIRLYMYVSTVPCESFSV